MVAERATKHSKSFMLLGRFYVILMSGTTSWIIEGVSLHTLYTIYGVCR